MYRKFGEIWNGNFHPCDDLLLWCVLWSSVCPSVCLSITNRCCLFVLIDVTERNWTCSLPDLSTASRIDPFFFQAGDCRRWPNMALVFIGSEILSYKYSMLQKTVFTRPAITLSKVKRLEWNLEQCEPNVGGWPFQHVQNWFSLVVAVWMGLNVSRQYYLSALMTWNVACSLFYLQQCVMTY